MCTKCPTNECWRCSIVFSLPVCRSVRGHSNSVIFNRIFSKFHIWIASINLLFKFEYGFCLTSDNQDGKQNGHQLSIFAVVVTLTQSFLIGFLPNFIYELLLSTFHSSSNMCFVQHPIIRWPTKWPLPICVCCRGHSNLVIFYRISFKFHLWIALIKLSFKMKYDFGLTNNSQDG